jgi:hypothetical protein
MPTRQPRLRYKVVHVSVLLRRLFILLLRTPQTLFGHTADTQNGEPRKAVPLTQTTAPVSRPRSVGLDGNGLEPEAVS